MGEEIRITNDVMFQNIFGKVGNERITKGFLEKILGIEIEELTLDTNKRLLGKMPEDKIGRIDVKAKLSDGTKVIIEMQVARYKYMAKRLLYYWAETYIGDLLRGEEYEELNKTIAILISAENLEETKEIPKYHTKWEIREEFDTEKKLTEDLEIHIIELNKFKEGEEERPEDNWVRFLKARGKEELEKIRDVDKELEEAKKELEYITSTPELREIYEQREKDLRDKISFARAEREEGIAEIVLNMYQERMSIEDICKFTKLSKEKVEKIIKENQK